MCPSALRFPSGCHKKSSIIVEKAWCVPFQVFKPKIFERTLWRGRQWVTLGFLVLFWEPRGRQCSIVKSSRQLESPWPGFVAWLKLPSYETEILLWLWPFPCEIGFELLVIIFIESQDNMCMDSVEQTIQNIPSGTDIVLKHHRFLMSRTLYPF